MKKRTKKKLEAVGAWIILILMVISLLSGLFIFF